MKLMLCVSGGDHEGSADAVMIDLTEEYARDLLRRRQLIQQLDACAEHFYEAKFWDASSYWIGGWDANGSYEWLEETLGEEGMRSLEAGNVVELPDDLEVPENFVQRTECELLHMSTDHIRFTSYPKHCDYTQESAPIPYGILEEAAGYRQAA
jgi:hypothetical protein